MVRTLVRTLAALAVLVVSSRALAQGSADQVVTAAQRKGDDGTRRVRWHDSTAIWQQRVGTQTLGVGADPQSSDPYYDWVFLLRPRYYFWENERSSLSVRAQLGATVELTNSDTTTEQNQFLIDDTILGLAPEHAFVQHGEYLTDLTLTLPRFVIPTSKAGHESGKILEVGVRGLFVQAFPLREGSDLLARGYFAVRAGYGYQFARSIVPESSTLDQVRMDLEGHIVTNDQLSGAALAEHVGVLHGIVHADVYRDTVALESEFGLDPLVKFPFNDSVSVCNLPTGCADVSPDPNAQRYVPATYLDAYLDVLVWDHALKVSLGYENITGQIAGGERRNFFWSPDAKFYLKLEFQPDFLVKKRGSASALGAPRSQLAGLSGRH